MSVVISKDQSTQPQEGIIHIADVHRMLTDFRQKINLNCVDPSRNPVPKRFYFNINIKRLEEIASKSADKEIIRINLSLNLQGQLDCEQKESIENSLSLLVCGVDKDKKSMLNHNDLVLVEGFIDNEDHKIPQKGQKRGADPCCVQGKPMFDV